MSNRSTPIVPHVLYVADQHHPWRLAAYERLATNYHTPTTVNLAFGTSDSTVKRAVGKSGVTKQQTHVWCIPDDAAWDRVVASRTALQVALDAFAEGLRQLGSYAKRLEAAGGIKKAPNPLSPTVIGAPDPDDADESYFISDPVPRLGREQISSHTPKMLHVERNGKPWSTTHQRGQFVCPDDAAWEHITALRDQVQAADTAWQQLLRALGTYRDAAADGRYAARAAAREEKPMSTKTPTPPAATDFWQALSHAHPTAHHWHHEGGDTYRSACGIRSRHHPVGTHDVGHCSRCTAAIGQPTTLTPAPASGALSTALQDCARRYVTAREQAGAALLEMAAALAEARHLAQHGDWYTFLESIGTGEDAADRLLNIHELAESNPAYADAIRRNFLNPTTAALLARPSTPAAVVEQVLAQPEPPKKREIETQIRDSKSRTGAGFETADAEHIAAARQLLVDAVGAGERTGTRLYQEAYAHARQVRDQAKYQALFAQIDRAVEGTAEQPAPSAAAEALPEAPADLIAAIRAGNHTYHGPCTIQGKLLYTIAHNDYPDNLRSFPEPELRAVFQTPGQTITIRVHDQDYAIVPTRRIKDLALHHSINHLQDWVITYIPSGGLIGKGFPTREVAEAALTDLGKLDWSGIQGTFVPPALGVQIREVLARHSDTPAAQPAKEIAAEEAPAQPAAARLPMRPSRPARDDVSVLLAYIRDLEAYADALEQLALAEVEVGT